MLGRVLPHSLSIMVTLPLRPVLSAQGGPPRLLLGPRGKPAVTPQCPCQGLWPPRRKTSVNAEARAQKANENLLAPRCHPGVCPAAASAGGLALLAAGAWRRGVQRCPAPEVRGVWERNAVHALWSSGIPIGGRRPTPLVVLLGRTGLGARFALVADACPGRRRRSASLAPQHGPRRPQRCALGCATRRGLAPLGAERAWVPWRASARRRSRARAACGPAPGFKWCRRSGVARRKRECPR